ncbi:cytochrome b subunit of formate dehydrogenase [Prescottella agglutinans]|uniref:Cytochrome b subunit of formate dehydrogenase n=1 Tax=Prescottella agglutinans TaxID=1644129 RepID=A0ABT6MIV5_9NOCA|nr:cytochrome b subunit of formate dehydrogenase [Prescottella agglutinans]
MTGLKKLVYPLSVALVLVILAVTGVISWTSFAWGAGSAALIAILLAIIEGTRLYRSRT